MSRHDDHQLSLGLDDGGPTGPTTRPAGAPPAPDQDARDRIVDDTSATLFVEAGAGAGKTTALVGRILTLVDQDVPIEAIAAITFTEKAAAELRHRVRRELTAGPDTPARRAALEHLDHAPVGTLHAFARRLLLEFPVEAGLPPGFDVLDELESQLAFDDRWQDLLDELLDDADLEVAPGLSARDLAVLFGWAKFGGMTGLRSIAEDFQANWDLVAERVALAPPARPALDLDAVVADARSIGATLVPDGDGQQTYVANIAEAGAALAAVAGTIHEIEALEQLRARTAKPKRVGAKKNWSTGGDLDELRQRELALSALAAEHLGAWREYRRLVVGAIVGRFVLEGARARAASGALEFHDLLVLARRVLSASATARRLLHQRYRRVLLDEFQDTDPIQLEIAVRLTADPESDAAFGHGLVPTPGRLFVVGDPKQSIYRFRRADVAAYLTAASRIDATEVRLSANFRSTGAVIDWVNGVFATVIEAEPEVQPAYQPLDVARPGSTDHGTVLVVGAAEHVDEPNADEVRWREARDVAAAAATAIHERWAVGDHDDAGRPMLRPCRLGDIAILLPARTSLPMLERALADLGVAYRAENAAVVYTAPEIRHVMLALRAAADPTDQLALVAALRSPLYGCSDVELFDWRRAGGRWNIFGTAPDELSEHPVAGALGHLRSIAERAGRVGPAELVGAMVDERRVLEVALAGADARDVWRRVRFVTDQARAWTDAGGRGLRRYLQWTKFQADEGRASDTILPERDHDAVRIMTVHAAKGLEFPITIVAGLTTLNRGRRRLSAVWPDDTWALAERDDPIFEAFRPLDEQMSDAERRRLLYVACTRAVDHLVVSLHRPALPASSKSAPGNWSSARVLASHGADGHGAASFAGTPDALDPPTAAPIELPWADHQEWATERRRAVRAAAVRTTTSATRLAAGMPTAAPGTDVDGDDLAHPADASGGADEDGDLLGLTVDVGLAKEPVDLDLPPWQRGRYGTAVGRAVHAVLQDADLTTGDDIDTLATAAAAAEGIFGLEPQVAALARSALGTPIVGAIAEGAEHWRELFVVADLGGTVLEGYIDLLVRTPDGLLIVDYKTDRFAPDDDDARAVRLGKYRLQLAAYAVALGRLVDEPIVGGILVHCRVDGPAEQLAVTDWADALATVDRSTR
ncbi:MAG: UvrD-helicase domain-containing protein [Desertimonas sp.]